MSDIRSKQATSEGKTGSDNVTACSMQALYIVDPSITPLLMRGSAITAALYNKITIDRKWKQVD